MATADKRVNFFDKRRMSKQDFDNYFFTYLDNKINDVVESAFLASSGVLSDQTIGLTSITDDTFSFDISLAWRGVDGSGNIMDLSQLATALYEEYSFENALGVTYYTGFRHQSVPSGVERNPRLTIPSYSYYEDTIGELGNPNSVTDGTTYIRLVVNSILESGVDHSGRPVTVYLNTPVSPLSTVAYYTGVVEYSAPDNYIDITYTPTAGPLGQTSPTYPISTTAADYWVHVKGVSWFKNTDIRSDNDYVFVGTALGTGSPSTPTVFDISDQVSALYLSLDNCYRAGTATDPAPGRSINVNKKAIDFNQTNTTLRDKDYSNTILSLDSFASTAVSSNLFMYEGYSNDTLPLLSLKSLSDGGTDLQAIEPGAVSIGTDEAEGTRGGIDLTNLSDLIDTTRDSWFVLIEGTTGNADDGLYLGDTITSAIAFTVKELDGSAVTFTTDSTCNLKFFIATEATYHSDWTDTTFTDKHSNTFNFSKSQNGLLISRRGDPTNEENKFLELEAYSGNGNERFFNITSTSISKFGGGQIFNYEYDQSGAVVGHAAFKADKRNIFGLTSLYRPSEGYGEWGFDYRGSQFARTAGDDGPYQLAFTDRIPYVEADTEAESTFTQISATELQITEAGFDNTEMPFGANNTGTLLAEVQYSPSAVADGIYLCWTKSGTTNITFKKLDGNSPSFSSGTGVIRFYAGSFLGNIPSNVPFSGSTSGFANVITAPNKQTGGLKLSHTSNDLIGTANYRFLSLAYNNSTAMWGIRDGGVMYARSITTKAPAAGHGLTQWDQIESSLISGTVVDGTTVQGATAHFTTLQLSEGTYDVELPASIGSCNIIKKAGGGTWGASKYLNLFSGTSEWESTAPGWTARCSGAGDKVLQSNVNSTVYKLPITVPYGATITYINIYVDPYATDFSIEAFRGSGTTAVASLSSAGATGTLGGTAAQIVTFTADQNNVFDNAAYVFTLDITASSTAGSSPDLVYYVEAEYTLANVGENWFYA